MGWTVEHNTGVVGGFVRCFYFKGHIYATTFADGVWRRPVAGPPWVQVFAGPVSGAGGRGWYWEQDGALYCGDTQNIYRSTDGVVWNLDVNLAVAFGLQAAYDNDSVIGGYGSYLYVANYDSVTPCTWFYRRDTAGTWVATPGARAGVIGAGHSGVIGFGGEIYYSTNTTVEYWDGAAWSPEPTLDGNCGFDSEFSIADHRLFVGSEYASGPGPGYYWKTAGVTNWSWRSLPIPNANWNVCPLCTGGDGEVHTITDDGGPDMRIYRLDPGTFTLVSMETIALNLSGIGAVCTLPNGEMYWAHWAGATMQFFAWVGVYNVTPVGGGCYPQAMDCDGDGKGLYIGLYDTATAQPLLIMVATPPDPEDAHGAVMFSPGAGTAINVKCTNLGNKLIVSGHFGANEQVEVSDNAGITWTDIDPGTWAANLAQPLVVDPLTLDEVMVALDALQDIMETTDGGTTWVTNNAAVGFSPGAMAKLVNGNELIIGDDGGNQIDYSPNRGVTLTNITGAFVGNVAALEIT